MDSQQLLLRIEAGDSRAAEAVFDRYVERLVALARARIGAKLRRRIDAEDVVQSAYRSFFVHAEKHEYVLGESGDLWRLLARITLNKLYSQVEQHTAARRNVNREREADPASPTNPIDLEPTAAEVIALTEQLQITTKDLSADEHEVLGAHLRGETVETIAGALQKSPRTVRRLLAHARRSFEEQLTSNTQAINLDARSRAKRGADPRAPLSYSDFRLERLLGSGGMGKVYRATQHSTGRTVAVKSLLKSRQADTNSVEKFLQEAQILASLSHPNIVGFQGVGHFPGGGYFIAMDYIDGEELQSRIAKRPLPVGEAVRIVRTVSQAVAHVHEKGIVHGDIKPANILVDRAGVVFVADFGLAQFSVVKPGIRPWLVGGTLGYMAPEVRTRGCLPGRLADVYGLGALLWSLCTGAVPRDALRFDSDVDVPGSLATVCGKCLADDPSQRYPSVAEFIEQLDRVEIEPA